MAVWEEVILRNEWPDCRYDDVAAPKYVKFTKAKPLGDSSTLPVDLAIPVFGYRHDLACIMHCRLADVAHTADFA
jgi:hypothetical protein